MLDRSIEDFKRGIAEMGAQAQQRMQEEIRRGREQRAHLPRQLDDEIDLEESDPNKAIIMQWDDGYGNIVYLNPVVSMNQVQAVSARITEQKGAFDALGIPDQTRFKTEFDSSKGIAEGIQPYKDYLKSDALGRRFQELKQTRPTPK